MSYKNMRFCENLNVLQFETDGTYNTPVLEPCNYVPTEFIGFNYARSIKDKKSKGVHFFIDDYQFERVWRMPTQYTSLLREFNTVLTPDFSLYTDYPKAIQIYNHYRKQWLGAYWQFLGLRVIPTIAWSNEDSYTWCFDGTPKGATVAVSSVGTQRSKASRLLFLAGWNEMIKRLKPETIIFYGDIPKECNGNIIRVKSFQEKFKEVKTDGW